MEKAKMIELALGLAVIGAILIGGFIFARQSERTARPKSNHH